MPLVCEPAVLADGKGVATAYINASIDDPFHCLSYPNVPKEPQVADMVARWPSTYSNPNWHFRKVVDTETGNIVGYTKWSLRNMQAGTLFPKRTDTAEDVEDPLKDAEPLGVVLNPEHSTWFMAQCKSIRSDATGNRPTLPPRRRGVGFADQHVLLTYVEASPNSRRIMEKLGFKKMGQIESEVANGGTYIYTCMMREPQ